MAIITFDTLAYANKLKSAGVPDEQAEIQAKTFAEIIEERLPTKQDIMDLRRDIKEMELRLTIRLGTIIAGAILIVATLVKLL